MERAYHNAAETYIHSAIVLLDRSNEESYSYIRPQGKYYDSLVEKGRPIKSISPNNNPAVAIENETEEKQVWTIDVSIISKHHFWHDNFNSKSSRFRRYTTQTKPLLPVHYKIYYLTVDGDQLTILFQIYGLPGYGHHHMNRLKLAIGPGAGCPTKGGDASTYPWGDSGSAYPTNYEEITPLCDAILMDIKLWNNLDKPWTDRSLNLGNGGLPFQGNTQVTYQVQANFYGRYTDPYNVQKGAKNPHELDFTEDNKVQENPGEDASRVPVVEFTLDFGKVGEALDT